MSPETWKRVRAVFDAAVDRPPGERSAYLDEACAGDDSLRRTVASLLEADARAGDRLEGPAWAEPAAEEASERLLGTRLGPHELVGVVGQGGMGVVYAAVRADDQFRKEVAVKLIKRGMDSAFILERFRHEREILAGLDHPSIARLLDAGTAPDGRPYLVMDFVDGQPIDRYCAEQRLGVRARLELYRQVCAAVAYAHQNLVVHRDLKPGNILVAADGTPKLLDFGIAKLLDPTGERQSTATGVLLATPEYASPEQVRGERITTASDVYSLGVLLYELLTGQKPYRFATRLPQELVRVVGEAEPERPSLAVRQEEGAPGRPPGSTRELRRALAGDLDNIVSMALRKEPARRYASVEQLSDDIRRHLESRVVRARPDTFTYRTARLVRRNRLASALLVLLVAWVGAATYQAQVARRERARAEQRFGEVRRLATSFLFDFHDAIRDLPGSTTAREMVVGKAVEHLDGLAREAARDAGLQRELGIAYGRLGQIEGGVGGASKGDTPRALAHLRTAVGLLEGAYAAQDDPRVAGELAEAHQALARILSGQGSFEEADRELERARGLAARASSALGGVADVLRQASIAQLHADLLSDRSDWERAVAHLQSALDLLRGVRAGDAAAEGVRRRRLTVAVRLGDALGQLGRPEQSLAVLQQTIADLDGPALPQVTAEQRMLAIANSMAGSALQDLGRHPEAAQRLARARVILEEMTRRDAANFQAGRDLSMTLALLCRSEQERGQTPAAREACAASVRVAEDLARRQPGDARATTALAFALDHNARQARAEGQLPRAAELYRRVAAVTPEGSDPWSKRALASARSGLAEVLAGMGRTRDAVAEARGALALLEEARAGVPEEATVLREVAEAQATLGRLLLPGPGGDEGRALMRSALQGFEALERQGTTAPDMREEMEALRRELAAAPAR